MKIKIFVLLLLLCVVKCARHNITLEGDTRVHFPLSTFGFFEGGKLIVNITRFSFELPDGKDLDDLPPFGFSLQRTTNDGVASYMEKVTKTCMLGQSPGLGFNDDIKMVLFHFNLSKERIDITKYGPRQFKRLQITNGVRGKNTSFTTKQFFLSHAAAVASGIMPSICYNSTNDEELFFCKVKSTKRMTFAGQFTVNVNCSQQSGLYNLYFHSCPQYEMKLPIDLEVHMIEHNTGTFLSAGEIPLPVMYGIMSLLFLVSGIIWTIYLRKFRMWTFKIHWLMAIVIFLKSVAVAFHAINYSTMGKEGFHVQTWAVLYYVIHLLKGALLFATIVLIGTGYFFIKHVLSSREKKLFIVVIPLQVVANVAQIIIDSTEEGLVSYQHWSQITIIVDLVCCGAILLPVVWSIKHLTQAAKTDGKAAVNLEKLKLFRHFYVMIVSYIYFTRIIVYLIKITVPFQLMWLDEFFTESATLLFFVLTGYMFRPANNNPYLHVPQDDFEDVEMDPISDHSAFGERLTRVKRVEHATT